MLANAELVNLFRNDDDAVAEEGSRQWDLACEEYRKRMGKLKYSLPDSVNKFMIMMNLHDAQWISSRTDPSGDKFVVVVQQTDGAYDPDHYIAILTYKGAAVETQQHTGAFNKSPDGRNWWMYDEFEMTDGGFLHEILFSDGI